MSAKFETGAIRHIFNAAKSPVVTRAQRGKEEYISRVADCYLGPRPDDGKRPLFDGTNGEGRLAVDLVGYAIIPLEACHEAATTIEHLRAELAGRDAEIARVVEQAATAGYIVCAETRHVTLGDKVREAILATAIAAGAYRKDDGDE